MAAVPIYSIKYPLSSIITFDLKKGPSQAATAQTYQRSGFTIEAAGYIGTYADIDGKRNRTAMAGGGDQVPDNGRNEQN
jgi:hypothetical protein